MSNCSLIAPKALDHWMELQELCINFISMKWGTNKVTENEGVIQLMKVVNQAKCIFHKIDGSNDVGLDGQIEVVEMGFATGFWIGLQMKSGHSYRSHDKIYIKADRQHFEYWRNHILPIAGVAYMPAEQKLYWVDITAFLAKHPEVIINGPYHIPVESGNDLRVDTFRQFVDNFLAYKISYGNDLHFGRALKQLSNVNESDSRADAVKALFAFHRHEKEAWFYLIQHFKAESNIKIQRLLILIYRHLESYGDIMWHEGNYVSDDICEYGKSTIRKSFGFSEICKLIQHEDGSICRGSFGLNVYVLLDLLPSIVDELIRIIKEPTTPDSQRSWSGLVVINQIQKHDLQRAINFAQSMITNFPKSEHREGFTAIKEHLETQGEVDFIS